MIMEIPGTQLILSEVVTEYIPWDLREICYRGSNFMIFRSGNNGKSWAQTGYEGNRVISLASNSQFLFAGSKNTHSQPSGGVDRSSDNGNSWTPLPDGIPSTPVLSTCS